MSSSNTLQKRLMYLNFLPGNTFSTVDQLVERQTSNPEVQGVQGSIPAWENQNLLKNFPAWEDFHLWLFGTLESYILRI